MFPILLIGARTSVAHDILGGLVVLALSLMSKQLRPSWHINA